MVRSLDWLTIIIYLALLALGWMSVCGASYDYSQGGDIFAFSSRSGMQIVWIGTSLLLGTLILLLDDRIFDSLSYIIYILLLILLAITPFLARDIKGSHSWIKIGSLSFQSAEFAKFATALAVAKFMSSYGFTITRWKNFLGAVLLVLIPMGLIVAQRETGSALVYLAFFLMFYREGMPGSVLFAGVAAVVYFVVGVRFSAEPLWATPTSVGTFSVLLLILGFTSGLIWVYCRNARPMRHLLIYGIGGAMVALFVSKFVIPFDISWVLLGLLLLAVFYLLYLALAEHSKRYAYIAGFAVGSLLFFYSTDFLMSRMEPHQQVRIQVLLGLKDDPKGTGYNVIQAKIAIGSGGLEGKGFLNGTQTKLKYVPEQDTDFIFCTVGEEEGFLGSAAVLLLFLALILRLIHVAERQPYTFGRVYGYSVMSIFLFHVFINVGMVLGLTPVIGIPLPFFSYGGSSLWGFTLLLFIFLRIDAGRNRLKH